MSANNTVTMRRSSVAKAPDVMTEPHEGQNRAPAGTGRAHEAQAIIAIVPNATARGGRYVPENDIDVSRSRSPNRVGGVWLPPRSADRSGRSGRNGLRQVGDDLGWVFQTNGYAQQAVRDADRRLFLG